MKKITKKFKKIYWWFLSYASKYYYGNFSNKLKIVGVTGTKGKTTTTTLLYRTAMALGFKAGLIGTVENRINGEKVETPGNLPQTTPDVFYLNKLFHKMRTAGCQYVFMEVSSHALDQDRVRGVNFTGAIFSNLTHEHLDYHKDLEDYFGAKRKLFQILSPSAFALLNTDDSYGKRLLEDKTVKGKKQSYGFKGSEDFHGEVKKLDETGLGLSLNGEEVTTKLMGQFNASNLLAVWAACKNLGFDMAKVKKIFETIEPPRGRFEHFTSATGVVVIVDYAHTPDSFEKILAAVRATNKTGGRLISLFGCGGNRDPFKRPIMGKIAVSCSDVSFFTSDNPRDEDPKDIISQMKGNLSPEELKKVVAVVDRHEAILEAVKMAKKGDMIVAMGKGHENYQEIKGVKHHFDDMEEFKKAYGL